MAPLRECMCILHFENNERVFLHFQDNWRTYSSFQLSLAFRHAYFYT